MVGSGIVEAMIKRETAGMSQKLIAELSKALAEIDRLKGLLRNLVDYVENTALLQCDCGQCALCEAKKEASE